MEHVITILYTVGCAGAPDAERVARGLAAKRENVSVEMVLVTEETQAHTRGFRGSPTVLVDGWDVEDEPQSPVGSMG